MWNGCQSSIISEGNMCKYTLRTGMNLSEFILIFFIQFLSHALLEFK
jgi:hypothetical protein